jgi:MFS family permease
MGDTVSVFGMEFVGLAVPIIAVQLLHAGAFQMGVLEAAQMLAFLLIGLPAGAWVDRWRKKRVIVWGDLVRGALLLTLPVAWLLDTLTLGQLYVVAFATGCVTVFFDVANQSYLPEIVDGDQLGDANSKLQASQQTAIVAGPALAAAAIRWVGAPLTVAVTSVCMALSSLLVSRVRHAEDAPDPAARKPLRTEIREGLAFVLRHPLLRRITACTAISNFGSSATGALFIIYVLRELGLAETTLGLIFSVAAVGGLLGALSASRFARLVGEGRAIPLASLLMAASAFAVPLASVLPPVPVLMVGWFLVSWSVVVYNVTQVSFRQRLCPKPLLGRMNASIRFLVWGPMPIGALMGGLLGETLGITRALWVLAGLATVAAAPVVFSPLLTMRELPRELDALASSRDGAGQDGRED